MTSEAPRRPAPNCGASCAAGPAPRRGAAPRPSSGKRGAGSLAGKIGPQQFVVHLFCLVSGKQRKPPPKKKKKNEKGELILVKGKARSWKAGSPMRNRRSWGAGGVWGLGALGGWLDGLIAGWIDRQTDRQTEEGVSKVWDSGGFCASVSCSLLTPLFCD